MHEPISTTIILASTGQLSAAGGSLNAKQGSYDFYNGLLELSLSLLRDFQRVRRCYSRRLGDRPLPSATIG